MASEAELAAKDRAGTEHVLFPGQKLANGAVIIGNDGSQSYDYPPKPYTVDEWAEAQARQEAYWARQKVIWGRIRRGLFLGLCAFAGLVLVLAAHHG